MENQVAFKMLEEIRLQCQFTEHAFHQLKTSMNAQDLTRVFFYLHAVVDHTSQISRLFWPERAESSERGRWLREKLAVEDGSPLKMTGIREEFESQDEKFETWLAGLESHDYVALNLMPMGSLADFNRDAFRRNLDTESLKFQFQGMTVDLHAVPAEIKRLDKTAQRWMDTHNPW